MNRPEDYEALADELDAFSDIVNGATLIPAQIDAIVSALREAASTERKYAHMCRDGHTEIGHNDSEHELCPVCRLTAELAVADAVADRLRISWREDVAAERTQLSSVSQERDEARRALIAIKDAPGGGPGKRIAMQALERLNVSR